MYLAMKEIKKEKLRFVMIVLVTALIAFLVYFLASLSYGLAQLNKTAINHWHATSIVVAKDANRNIYASAMDLDKIENVGLNPENGINVTKTTVYVDHDQSRNGEPVDLVLIGYDLANTQVSAPLISGRAVMARDEIVVSRNFKQKVSIALGDVIEVAKTGRPFKVVGFTQDSNYNTAPVGYVSQEMASQAMMQVNVANGESDAVAAPTPHTPRRVSAVLVYEPLDTSKLDGSNFEMVSIDQFIQSIPGYQPQVLTFGFMIVSLMLISAIIIGIFMYILTMQKRAIFGVLKIQGYRNGMIMKSVLYQSLILVMVGFGLGLILTLITIRVMPAKVPVELYWPLNAGATVFTVVCSFLGTLLSARSILKIDPLEAL